MNEQVNVEDVVNALVGQVDRLVRDNALLEARVAGLARQLSEKENATGKDGKANK